MTSLSPILYKYLVTFQSTVPKLVSQGLGVDPVYLYRKHLGAMINCLISYRNKSTRWTLKKEIENILIYITTLT